MALPMRSTLSLGTILACVAAHGSKNKRRGGKYLRLIIFFCQSECFVRMIARILLNKLRLLFSISVARSTTIRTA